MSNKIYFRLKEVTDEGEGFSIDLPEEEVEQFIQIWKSSCLDFTPLSIEKVADEDDYEASMSDRTSIEKMKDYLSAIFTIDKD
jgi:hypothetical protein